MCTNKCSSKDSRICTESKNFFLGISSNIFLSYLKEFAQTKNNFRAYLEGEGGEERCGLLDAEDVDGGATHSRRAAAMLLLL
jgi:hypothetical protein